MNQLPVSRHFDCMAKCRERIWGCAGACERMCFPPPADELQRLRAERDELLLKSNQARIRCLALEAENAALQADARRFAHIIDTAYIGVSPYERRLLWCLRGVFAKNGQTFREAIDAAMGEPS